MADTFGDACVRDAGQFHLGAEPVAGDLHRAADDADKNGGDRPCHDRIHFVVSFLP
ncbi:hypothetical protein [Streptomyces cyaneofuscatus]